MKKAIITLTTAVFLTMFLTISTLAAVYQAYTTDDFVINNGADIKLNDDSGTYNGKMLSGFTRDDEGSNDFTTLKFSIPSDGKYAVWFLVSATGDTDNSLFLSLDDGDLFTCDYLEGEDSYYNNWYYMWMNSRSEIVEETGMENVGSAAALTGQKKYFDLKTGDHTLKIITREPEAKYAAVIITDDLNYDPNKDAKLNGSKGNPKTALTVTASNIEAAKPEQNTPATASVELEQNIPAAVATESVQNTPALSAPQTGDSAIFFFISAMMASSIVVLKIRKARS